MKTIKVETKDTKLDFCDYARKLLSEGEKEDSQLEFYRGEMLCLYGEIGKAAKVTILENAKRGPEFRKYTPFPGNR